MKYKIQKNIYKLPLHLYKTALGESLMTNNCGSVLSLMLYYVLHSHFVLCVSCKLVTVLYISYGIHTD